MSWKGKHIRVLLKISAVPFPWCTSKSIIRIFLRVYCPIKIELQLLGHLANKSFTMSGISMMCPSCNIKETFVSKDFEHKLLFLVILNSRSISFWGKPIFRAFDLVSWIRSFTYSCLWIAKTGCKSQISGAKSWILKLSLHVIIVEEVIHISTLESMSFWQRMLIYGWNAIGNIKLFWNS
jgi:hypothetical protein